MGVFDALKRQLSSVIEWKPRDMRVVWYKFPAEHDEVMNASKLIVQPGQGCILVYEGQVRDVLSDPGIYNLKTDNHPFITTLLNVRQRFASEHKVYIYFYRTADVVDQPWGTANPIKYRDPVYDFPVELGVNGTYVYRISDPEHFYGNIVSGKEWMSTQELAEIINHKIVQNIRQVMASASYSYTDVDAHSQELAAEVRSALTEDFASVGLTVLDFKILGTHFDRATIERIEHVAEMTSEVRAAEQAGLQYTELQKIRALRDAAKNEGGLAGIGAQLGAGAEIGKIFSPQPSPEAHNTVSNVDATDAILGKLKELKQLLDADVITQEEFDGLKKQYLSHLAKGPS